MMRFKYLASLLFVGLFSFRSQAQPDGFKKDLAQIQKKYKSTKVSYDFEYRYFNALNKQPFLTQKGSLKMEKRKFNYCMDYLECISDGSVFVSIDKESQFVTLDKAGFGNLFSAAPILPDSFVKSCLNVTLLNEQAGVKTYQIIPLKGPIKKMLLSFKAASYTLVSLVYFPSEIPSDQAEDYDPKETPQRIELSFSNTRFSPKWTTDVFAVNHIIIKQGGNYILQPTYKAFHFINHLSLK